MSSSKSGVLLTRIDHLRFRRKWDECLVLCNKFIYIESICKIIMLEKRLENGLVDICEAKLDMTELRVIYKVIIASVWQSVSSKYEKDMHLLSLKCLFALGNYNELLQAFALFNIKPEDFNGSRSKVILAESYLFCGKSLEKLGLKCDKTGVSATKYYELASGIAIELLQQLHLLIPESEDLSAELGYHLAEAIQIHLKNQINTLTSNQAIRTFRDILMVDRIEKLSNLYKSIIERYIEYLLQETTLINYETTSELLVPTISLSTTDDFNREEELYYLICIYHKLMKSSLLVGSQVKVSSKTIKLVDYYTILFGSVSCLDKLNSTLWNILEYCLGDFYPLRQFAFTLAKIKKYEQCYNFLNICHSLMPNDIDTLIQIINIHFDPKSTLSLDTKLEGYTTKLLELCDAESPLHSRALLYCGLYHSLAARQTEMLSEAKIHFSIAVEFFNRSHEADQNDYLPVFHLSLHHASARRIDNALHYCQVAIQLQWHNETLLNLYALLLTASKNYQEAYKVIESSILQYPLTINFYLIKSHIESQEGNYSSALQTCGRMLNLLTKIEEETQFPETELESKIPYKPTNLNLNLNDSIACFSTSLSDINNGTEFKESSKSFMEFIIWIRTAQIFLELDKLDDVKSCLLEAQNISPNSLSLQLMKARLLRRQKKCALALECFLTLGSIDPRNFEILYELGLTYFEMGNFSESENYLREAIQVDSVEHSSWGLLGKVLESTGDYEKASSCFLHAHDLFKSAPVMPFSGIPFHYK